MLAKDIHTVIPCYLQRLAPVKNVTKCKIWIVVQQNTLKLLSCQIESPLWPPIRSLKLDLHSLAWKMACDWQKKLRAVNIAFIADMWRTVY